MSSYPHTWSTCRSHRKQCGPHRHGVGRAFFFVHSRGDVLHFLLKCCMSHVILPSHMVHVQELAEAVQTPQAWSQLNNTHHSLYIEVWRNGVVYVPCHPTITHGAHSGASNGSAHDRESGVTVPNHSKICMTPGARETVLHFFHNFIACCAQSRKIKPP